MFGIEKSGNLLAFFVVISNSRDKSLSLLERMARTVAMVPVVIGGVLGGIGGFWMGRTGSCTTGGCPLTSNPWIGMVYGAVLGGMIASIFMGLF